MERARVLDETEKFYGCTNRSYRPTNAGLPTACSYGKSLRSSSSAS